MRHLWAVAAAVCWACSTTSGAPAPDDASVGGDNSEGGSTFCPDPCIPYVPLSCFSPTHLPCPPNTFQSWDGCYSAICCPNGASDASDDAAMRGDGPDAAADAAVDAVGDSTSSGDGSQGDGQPGDGAVE